MRYTILALSLALAAPANAVVIVNGVAGEDVDNASPFETLQAAVTFANTTAENVVEIQRNGNMAGAEIVGIDLNDDLTIQVAPGFTPVITSAINLQPTTSTKTVNLLNVNVSTTGQGTPLIVGCSISATNSYFSTTPTAGTGAYGPAVSAAIPSNGTNYSLNMTSCTMIGHFGLQAGRAVRDYTLTNCVAIGQVTDLPPIFSVGILNNMNWQSSYSYRIGLAQGYDEIQEPRTITLVNCIVRGGTPLAWPHSTLGQVHYENENRTIGPVNAINTVFHSLNINGAGEASRIDFPTLPDNQESSSNFNHCTFRTPNAFGLVYFWGSQPNTTMTFNNCLFDGLLMNYAIGLADAALGNVTLAGNSNTYHVPPGTALLPPDMPRFETTQYADIIPSATTDPLMTDINGDLVIRHAEIVARALPTVPPVLFDKHNNPRPMPASALRSDIGADEVDETSPASIRDWAVY